MAISNVRRLTLVAVLGLATPVCAGDKAAPTDAAASEKKICRSIETTGSMMMHRICHTRAEWSQIDAANGKSTDNFRAATQSNFGGERPR